MKREEKRRLGYLVTWVGLGHVATYTMVALSCHAMAARRKFATEICHDFFITLIKNLDRLRWANKYVGHKEFGFAHPTTFFTH